MHLKTLTYKSDERVNYTNATGAIVYAGTPVQVAGRVGIVQNDIPIGESDEVLVKGRFKGNQAAVVITAGQKVGYDLNGSPVVGTALSGAYTNVVANMDFVVGTAELTTANTDEEVLIDLNEFTSTEILDALPAQAHIADVAAVTQNTLTLTSMTGTANTAPAADTVPTKLTGTLTGTVNGAIVDIAATAGNCQGSATPSAAQVDTAIATAVATIVSGTNEQLKELQTSLAAVIDLNTVLVNNNKTFATELNAARADNAAQVIKINALLAAMETGQIVAAS